MTFTFKPAVRSKVGLLIGMIGGTGSGKTFSALRLASGMTPKGERFAVIDTEAGRAKHYADQFQFDHGDLAPPFRPDHYIEAIMAADKAGYPVIVVDSVSHVWAGDGGILDWQEEELDRMAGDDWKKREAVKMASWIKPKMSHKQMVQKLLQVRAHLILCFRAEEKIEMVRDDNNKMKIVPKVTLTGLDGWVPICEKSLPYELTASILLMAKEPGIPHPIKLQQQHKPMIDLTQPINEETGRKLAAWANGDDTQAKHHVDHTDALRNLLTVNNIPEADFLKAGQKGDLNEVADLAKATAWILKNKRLGAQESEFTAAKSDIPAELTMTYAQVAEKIKKSDALDVLEMAGDFINAVANIDQRLELRVLYTTKLERLRQAGK